MVLLSQSLIVGRRRSPVLILVGTLFPPGAPRGSNFSNVNEHIPLNIHVVGDRVKLDNWWEGLELFCSHNPLKQTMAIFGGGSIIKQSGGNHEVNPGDQ